MTLAASTVCDLVLPLWELSPLIRAIRFSCTQAILPRRWSGGGLWSERPMRPSSRCLCEGLPWLQGDRGPL